MSDHELLSPHNSESGWDNVAMKMSWYAFFEKINSRAGGRLFRLESKTVGGDNSAPKRALSTNNLVSIKSCLIYAQFDTAIHLN